MGSQGQWVGQRGGGGYLCACTCVIVIEALGWDGLNPQDVFSNPRTFQVKARQEPGTVIGTHLGKEHLPVLSETLAFPPHTPFLQELTCG